jgi:NTE family protein
LAHVLETETPASWRREADGVFKGGGVKGLALIGALEGFAAHPRWPVDRWLNVAGASAGAIIAAYLAYDRSPNIGTKMLTFFDPERLASFQDFPRGRKYLGGVPRLLTKRGMAPGDAFETWLDGILGHATFALARPEDGSDDWSQSSLKLIACDITNRRLLVLPEDLAHYRLPGTRAAIDPATFPISKAVRMSMSIPYFFQPVELEQVRDRDPDRQASLVTIPARPATIVDGGTLSNFPVWLFDRPNPRRPTFGFNLRGGQNVAAGMNQMLARLPWPLRLGFDILHTAQDAWDERLSTHSTNVRTLTVDATVRRRDGSLYPVAATDFALSQELQDLLVENGRRAATAFLDRFELSEYMNTLHAAPPVAS